MKNHCTPKIFIGLSGGVDSAVSAALLKRAGYSVTGVYIKVWQPDWISCTWKEERRDAMRVAANLDIPFVTLDLIKEYKQGVIDYMLAEYSAGCTPNPDVMCNREVKFGGFWKWAKAQGADFVATGHYAQVVKATTPKNVAGNVNGDFSMLAGVDKNKDQSYFLWTLTSEDLKHVLFPVGHLTKPEVRKLAAKFGLPNAKKKDSQGLCFIGKVDIKEFLKHYVKKGDAGVGAGDVLDVKGEIIGHHPGALFFTLGERHGFTITKKATDDKRLFVSAKDMKVNTITVSDREGVCGGVGSIGAVNGDGKPMIVDVARTSWVRSTPKMGDFVDVRTRYRQPLVKAEVVKVDDGAHSALFKLSKITDPVTPGQSLVVYRGEECLGGGIIS